MKYSSENVEILLSLLEIYETIEQDSLNIQLTEQCIEQLHDIYDKNHWEIDETHRFMLMGLLVLYLKNGEEQNAETLYNKILKQSDEKWPPLEEIKEMVKNQL